MANRDKTSQDGMGIFGLIALFAGVLAVVVLLLFSRGDRIDTTNQKNETSPAATTTGQGRNVPAPRAPAAP